MNGLLRLLLLTALCSDQVFATTIFLPGAQVKDLMWRGYNSESRSVGLPCVDGGLQIKPLEQSSFSFLYDESFDSLMRENAGKASGSVNALVISGSASREFLIRKSQYVQSIHALWTFEYKKGWAGSSSPQLNLLGESAARRDRAGRLETCGDSFIGKVLVGTKLYVSASIFFFDKEEYQRFKTKVSGSALGGLVKKSKTSIEEVRSFQKSAILSVSAMQIGGSPEKLKSILGTSEIYCTLDNVDACADGYDALVGYARSQDIFPSPANTSLSDLPVLHGVTNTYVEYGLDSLADAEVHPELNFLEKSLYVTQLRKDLSKLLWEQDVLVAEKSHPNTTNQRKAEIEQNLLNLQDKAETMRFRIKLCEQGGSSEAC